MQLRTAVTVGLASPFLIAALPASASPPEQSEPRELVVGQQQSPMQIDAAGLSVSIGPPQLEAVNSLDTYDLLKYVPNSFIAERFAGDEAPISLRGTNTAQTARTLVLVDGFVVSNFLGSGEGFAPKLSITGPSEAQQLDVVYGPYSARYGGNSMGGIVSITTLEPRKKTGYVTTRAFAMPFKEYGIDETFTGYSVEAGGSWKQASSPWSARLSARHIDNVGQSTTYGLLAPSAGPTIPVVGAYVDPRLPTPVFGASSPVGVVQDQFRARLGYEFKNGWQLEGLFFGSLTDQELTEPRTFLFDAAGQPVYVGRVNFNGSVYTATGLTYSLAQRSEFLTGLKATGEIADWKATVNLSRYWIDAQDTRTSLDYFTGASNQSGTWNLQDDPGWTTLNAYAERAFGRHQLAFGVNADQYDTRQANYETVSWRYASSAFLRSESYGETQSAGVFVEDEIQLSPAVALTIGARADWWEAFNGGVERDVASVQVVESFPDRRQAFVSPKLNLLVVPREDWALQLSLGSATRFPTVGELFQGRIDTRTRALDLNSFDPNLRPERSRDANVVLQKRFRGLQLTTSVFYQEVDDSIYLFSGLNQFGVVSTSYKNIERVRQFGAELIAEARDFLIDGLDWEMAVARIDARTVRNSANTATEDQMFPQVPDWRASGQLRYRIGERVQASLGWRYASRPNSDLPGQLRGDAYGFYSEYFVSDARLSWKINDTFEASLGVDNLTNEPAYGFYPLSQRSGLAELRIVF